MSRFYMVYSLKNDGKLERFEDEREAKERAIWKAHQSMDREPIYVLTVTSVFQRPLPTDIKELTP